MLLMHVRQPQDLSGVLCQVWWEDCPIPDHPDVSREKFEILCKQLQQNLSSNNSKYTLYISYWLSSIGISSLQVEVLKQLLQEEGKKVHIIILLCTKSWVSSFTVCQVFIYK